MNIVLDTNIIISALWSSGHTITKILEAVIGGHFTVCYDFRIIDEYIRVMHYPKFDFKEEEISAILNPLIKNGISVIADSLDSITFPDETDKKFYEVAVAASAVLVTGNIKHFTDDGIAMKPADFFEKYLTK